MYLFLIVGHTGQGKTTWVKNFVAGKNVYVFDVNNEFTDLPLDFTYSPRMRHAALEVKRFLFVAENLRNTNIIFEDATGFFRGKQSPDLIKQIVKKRHTGNVFLILFHSINRVPPELLEMSNYVILFKTNDNAETIDKKFHSEQLNKGFLKAKNNPPYTPVQIKMI